jgi:hypothetical protein
MMINVYLDGNLRQNVVEASTQLNYIKRIQGDKIVTERGLVEVIIKRRTADVIEGDTHIMEDTI